MEWWMSALVIGGAFVGGSGATAFARRRRRRARSPFVDPRKVPDAIPPLADRSHALSLSSVEGPLDKPLVQTRDMVGWNLALDPAPAQPDAEDYLRSSEPPFPVSRAGVPEGVAVWDATLDRCPECKHCIGSSNTIQGVPYTLCTARPDGTFCGKYRTVIYLSDDQLGEAAIEAREAMLRLHYDVPTVIPDDEEIAAWYKRRLLK